MVVVLIIACSVIEEHANPYLHWYHFLYTHRKGWFVSSWIYRKRGVYYSI